MMAHLNSDIPEDAHCSEIVNCSGLHKNRQGQRHHQRPERLVC